MQKILVSACLLARKVRYNGADKYLADDILARWISQDRVIAVCPEVAAGLGIPRPPAEIKGGSGDDVLGDTAKVFENTGRDVSEAFRQGAQTALALAQAHNCKFALLIDGSPSCGSSFIYDGSFSRTRVPGAGVTAALLRANGIQVFAPADIAALDALISSCLV
jgi:uncharacterized protein YbbK (DUF523 family)